MLQAQMLKILSERLAEGGKCPHNANCPHGAGRRCTASPAELEAIETRMRGEFMRDIGAGCVLFHLDPQKEWPCFAVKHLKIILDPEPAEG